MNKTYFITWADKAYRDRWFFNTLLASAKRNKVDLIVVKAEELTLPKYVDVRAVELGFFLQDPQIQAIDDEDNIMLLGGDQYFVSPITGLPNPEEFFYMGLDESKDDTISENIARTGNRRPEAISELGYDPQILAGNSGSSFAKKKTWVKLFKEIEPKIETFSRMCNCWQILLAAESGKQGIRKIMPQKWSVHSHCNPLKRGIQVNQEGIYDEFGNKCQIIHAFFNFQKA